MNRTKLKTYAPQARREFIQAITDRAAFYGLTANIIEPVTAEQGDVAIIGGKPFPRAILEKRNKLIERIQQNGFTPTMEAIAYTWFNRFVAIRFMELHGYLDHGYRVLSHPEAKDTPEILLHAEHVALPGLNRDKVIELKLDGTKEAELYRLLLVAQCNALSAAMPFLFERLDDETELLLPDNLLHSDSLLRKLVNGIDESDWQQVEIIGWLYQFYISEKKDEVIGKVVKSEDIPAATQLFTPNWIVKYLVQNSIGRMWLEAYPTSNLASKMEYFIGLRNADLGLRIEEAEPAASTARVTAEESAIHNPHSAISNLQSAIHNPHSAINPEDITVLDPACGSGHILVEAYDLLKEIYLERGYRLRDIPRLILGKNLFGLDIDDRAAQLASFALLMKARADDRRIFDGANGSESALPNPHSAIVNVLTIPDSSALSVRPHQLAESLFSAEARRGAVPIRESNYIFGEMEAQPSLLMIDDSAQTRNPKPETRNPTTEQHLIDLLERFEMGKTLGSLIRMPAGYGPTLAAIAELIADKQAHGDIYEKTAARQMEPFVRAAELLHAQYDCVIANPPYMGGKFQTSSIREFAKRQFPDSKSDLFAMFIERNFELTKPDGLLGLMTPFVWMFLSSYEKLRQRMTTEITILSLVRPEYHAFFDSAYVPICAFILLNAKSNSKGDFFDLSNFYGAELQPTKFLEAISNPHCSWRFRASGDDFNRIPGSPIAYWVSNKMREVFEKGTPLGDIAEPRQGLVTADNDRFLRFWFEPSVSKIKFDTKDKSDSIKSSARWFPHTKGGKFRRWYGNNDYVINYYNDGEELRSFGCEENGRAKSRVQNTDFFFKPAISWSDVTTSLFAARMIPEGFTYNVTGPALFLKEDGNFKWLLGYVNSSVFQSMLSISLQGLHYNNGVIALLPIHQGITLPSQDSFIDELVDLARDDWDSFETSWDFQIFPLLRSDLKAATVEQSFLHWQDACHANLQRMQELETENNRLFIDAYGLQDELSPDVPEAQITLARADRRDDIKRLLSYALGCLMGRYSLDRARLVYADSGNRDFEKIYYGIAECGLGSADSLQPVSETSKAETSGATLQALPPHSALRIPQSIFSPDADGIVPVMEMDWFDDDATNRVVEFVETAWSAERCGTGSVSDLTSPDVLLTGEQVAHAPRTASGSQLEANLRWIAESLGTSRDDDARATIRRYFAAGFFKDHLKTYKKRPIYWLFSSGKQRAFQCLVYLHRYHEGTLARMRTEYVIPLQGKIAVRIAQLESDKLAATSTSHRKKLDKEQDTLKKQQTELVTFDEKLRHYADLRIALDLDDGVKVNYGKFGDLLAEVKAVTGGSEE